SEIMWTQTSEFIMDDFCHCGKSAVKKTSWTDMNPGRRYSTCKNFLEVGGCTYRCWIDPPICARARQIIPGLVKRVSMLEGDVCHGRCREKILWLVLIVSWLMMFLFFK
ncbi:GRF zinc finger containing protein, partial [Striga asiatica]